MPYTEMSIPEGRRYLPSVWNLFFKPLTDENFFVEPWKNCELRDCAEFRLGNGRNGSHEILFFVTDEKLISFLQETSGEVYLFGAYNPINVCQMRARGTVVREENYPNVEQVKTRLHIAIERRVGAMVSKLNQEEAEERFTILHNGLLFCFRVNVYAYQMYERG